jgi:prepilin signal peptidase PulO-like enzyme (type II secretory pathway)
MLKIAGLTLNILIWLGVAVIAVLMFVVPLVTALLMNYNVHLGESGMASLEKLQQYQIVALHIFCWTWIFFVGGCFASFLNVVAWRVPRRKSILGSSHCPQCEIKLSFRNNLPILGWLRNGGRCANCEKSIPVRYLLAEVVLGSVFVTLFFFETASGGASIPFREINFLHGIEATLFDPKWELLSHLVLHLILLSTLFTIAIISSEQFFAPWSLVAFALGSMLAIQCFDSAPGIVDFQLGSLSSVGETSKGFLYLLNSPAQFGIAYGVGIVAGVACHFLLALSSVDKPRFGQLACMILIGASLGWQATISISLIYVFIRLLWTIVTGFRTVGVNECGLMMLAALVHLCCWRQQLACDYWPGPNCDARQLPLSVVCIVVFSTCGRFCRTFARDKVNIVAN